MVGNSGGGDTESEMLPKVLGALAFGEEEEEKKKAEKEEEEEEEAASGLQGTLRKHKPGCPAQRNTTLGTGIEAKPIQMRN